MVHRVGVAQVLRASGRASRAWLWQTRALGATDAPLRRRMALAHAAAEEVHWRPFEFANASIGLVPMPPLCAETGSHTVYLHTVHSLRSQCSC